MGGWMGGWVEERECEAARRVERQGAEEMRACMLGAIRNASPPAGGIAGPASPPCPTDLGMKPPPANSEASKFMARVGGGKRDGRSFERRMKD